MCSGSHRTRSEKLSPPDGIGFQVISSDESMRHVDKLTDLYLRSTTSLTECLRPLNIHASHETATAYCYELDTEFLIKHSQSPVILILASRLV